ncbi:MAG: alpha/beta hydrolase, partial [Chthoniobacterales bacterium]|nr:alpha/beta hydrolase [Chthoniobacterales bacterium]
MSLWKLLKIGRQQQAFGVGLGIGLLGAILLALRYGFRRRGAAVLPESLSPAIFATRVVATSRGQMVYHTSGGGEGLIFVHGVYPGASSFEWSRVYPHFAVTHEVIVPDLIGFGESERPGEALDMRELGEAFVEFLHLVVGGRAPVVVGSGVSGKMLLLVAAQHPELFSKLILWLPLGVRQALRGRAARRVLGIERLPWLRSLAWGSYLSSAQFLRAWLARVGYGERGSEDEEALAVLTNCAGLYHAEVAMWGYFQGTFGEDLAPRLRDIRCPVSILWPQEGTNYPVGEGETLAREIEGARLRLVAAD